MSGSMHKSGGGPPQHEVLSIESQSDIDRKKSNFSVSLSPGKVPPPTDINSPQDPEAENSGKRSSGFLWATETDYCIFFKV